MLGRIIEVLIANVKQYTINDYTFGKDTGAHSVRSETVVVSIGKDLQFITRAGTYAQPFGWLNADFRSQREIVAEVAVHIAADKELHCSFGFCIRLGVAA